MPHANATGKDIDNNSAFATFLTSVYASSCHKMSSAQDTVKAVKCLVGWRCSHLFFVLVIETKNFLKQSVPELVYLSAFVTSIQPVWKQYQTR